MKTVDYTVVLEPNQDESGYTATGPALPGCIRAGETVDDALENIRDAMDLWIKMARDEGEDVPGDFTVISKISVGV